MQRAIGHQGGTGTAPSQVEELLSTGQPQADGDRSTLEQFAEMTAHWALLNLRSYAIGMRIDQWLAGDHPELRSLQAAGIESMQKENLLLLPTTRKMAAWLIILLLIAIFPANIQMMLHYMDENNPRLWMAVVRLPLQVLLIWWAYGFFNVWWSGKCRK